MTGLRPAWPGGWSVAALPWPLMVCAELAWLWRTAQLCQAPAPAWHIFDTMLALHVSTWHLGAWYVKCVEGDSRLPYMLTCRSI